MSLRMPTLLPSALLHISQSTFAWWSVSRGEGGDLAEEGREIVAIHGHTKSDCGVVEVGECGWEGGLTPRGAVKVLGAFDLAATALLGLIQSAIDKLPIKVLPTA